MEENCFLKTTNLQCVFHYTYTSIHNIIACTVYTYHARWNSHGVVIVCITELGLGPPGSRGLTRICMSEINKQVTQKALSHSIRAINRS